MALALAFVSLALATGERASRSCSSNLPCSRLPMPLCQPACSRFFGRLLVQHSSYPYMGAILPLVQQYSNQSPPYMAIAATVTAADGLRPAALRGDCGGAREQRRRGGHNPPLVRRCFPHSFAVPCYSFPCSPITAVVVPYLPISPLVYRSSIAYLLPIEANAIAYVYHSPCTIGVSYVGKVMNYSTRLYIHYPVFAAVHQCTNLKCKIILGALLSP